MDHLLRVKGRGELCLGEAARLWTPRGFSGRLGWSPEVGGHYRASVGWQPSLAVFVLKLQPSVARPGLA